MLLLAACSEYQIEKEQDPVSGASPEIEVSPEAVVMAVCAPPGEAEVTIRNVGDAALEVTGIEIDSTTWTVSPPALPFSIAAGDSTVLRLTGSGGAATLRITSDDADEPTVLVPLELGADTPPRVDIGLPTEGEIVPQSADLVLTGSVADDEDAPEALSVTWSASVDGVLSTAPADASGVTTVTWPASARSGGPQSVTLEATDSCGLTASATVSFCQDGAYTYDGLDLTAWHYEGAAYYDAYTAYLVLTTPATDQVGSAFETSSPVNGDNVQIDFLFYIGGGSGADGISLTTLDTDRMNTFLGGTGCGIGYGGDASCTSGPALPGWSIEVDTYYNDGHDPTPEDHVAFTFDGDVDGPAAWATLPEMEDSGWHQMVVRVLAPRVTVEIDGVTYIDGDYAGYYTFPGYVGFTAGTGSLTNYHIIDSLLVTDYACD